MLKEGKLAIIVTLDVKEAFDSAWWPNIIVALQEFKCKKIIKPSKKLLKWKNSYHKHKQHTN